MLLRKQCSVLYQYLIHERLSLGMARADHITDCGIAIEVQRWRSMPSHYIRLQESVFISSNKQWLPSSHLLSERLKYYMGICQVLHKQSQGFD